MNNSNTTLVPLLTMELNVYQKQRTYESQTLINKYIKPK